jgi:hypothetical protein
MGQARIHLIGLTETKRLQGFLLKPFSENTKKMATTATAIAATTNNKVNRAPPTVFLGSGTAAGLGVGKVSEATEGLGSSAVGVAVGAGTGGSANEGSGVPVVKVPVEGEGIDIGLVVGSGEARC